MIDNEVVVLTGEYVQTHCRLLVVRIENASTLLSSRG
jgi:hypothetical protein